MEDRIIKETKTPGTETVHMPDGKTVVVKSITTDTYWASGRKDCHVQLERPLDMGGQVIPLNGK